MKARFLAPAEIEMFDAAVFYEKQVSQLGANFLSILESAIRDICEQPEAWPDIGYGIRKRQLRRFPYSVIYQIDDSDYRCYKGQSCSNYRKVSVEIIGEIVGMNIYAVPKHKRIGQIKCIALCIENTYLAV